MSTPKMNIKTGDTVVVISGKDKKTQGKVTKAFPKDGKVKASRWFRVIKSPVDRECPAESSRRKPPFRSPR